MVYQHMSDELAELQKEFRQSVLTSLAELKAGQRTIEIDLSGLKSTITKETVAGIHERLDALERTKTQFITAFVVIQGLIIAAWAIVEKLWKD